MTRKVKILWIVVLAVIVFAILFTSGIGLGSVFYVLGREKKYPLSETNVQITAMDGVALRAYEQSDEENHRWAILVHSYRTGHGFMRDYAEKYRSEGWNTLQPDNRAHGQSEGKFIGMGYLDSEDVLCWIRYIVERDEQAEIYLHGVSMGGTTVMLVAARKDLPPNVKAVAEDCGYASAEEYLTWKLKQKMHLPAFPIIPIANLFFRICAGYSMQDASATEAVQNSTLPILFIHGKKDETVSVQVAYTLYDKAVCRKQLYIADEAGHGESMYVDATTYWEKVFSFFGVI